MKKPEWVLREMVFAAHEQSLAQFGGAAGVRDEGLLDSALGKPLNLFAYGRPDLFDLAASYAFGIVRNHPFIDGNKRTGFVVAVAFLELNGRRLQASEVDATLQTLALAAGDMSEAAFAEWLKANSKRA
ncbi:MAG: type II toxin-antitoxin system death-on-curing family toxin [Limisphaerales bacterium]